MTTPRFGSNNPAEDPAGTCYRHPERTSYVLCQRCGRTLCPECQAPAAVGFHCPECLREARATAPRTKPRLIGSARRLASDGSPVVTYVLMAICVVVYLAQFVLGDVITRNIAYFPVLTAREPWTMLTSIFAHGSIFHLAFNMLSLFIFGRILEGLLGRWRLLALYLISGLGGSVAVLLLNPLEGVLGASGAIFGLMGAMLVIQRGLGGNGTQLAILIGLNLLLGFLPGTSISWQAHVGGLVVGAAIAWIFSRTRRRSHRTVQVLGIAGVVAALITITVLVFGVFSS